MCGLGAPARIVARMAIIDDLYRLLRPLSLRVANMIGRCNVLLVEVGGLRLQIEVMGVPIPDAEHHQPYGFYSVPLPGATGVAVFPNGDQGHPLVPVVSDRRYRPKDAKPGEAGLHNHVGLRLAMLPDRTIEARSTDGHAERLPTLADYNRLLDAFNAHVHFVATTGSATAQSGTSAPIEKKVTGPDGTRVFRTE